MSSTSSLLHPPINTCIQRDVQIVPAPHSKSTCNGFIDSPHAHPCRKLVKKDTICVEVQSTWKGKIKIWRYHPQCAFNLDEIADASDITGRTCTCRARNCPNHKLCHTYCRDSHCEHKFETGELRIRVGGKWFCTSCIQQSQSLLGISVSEVGGFDCISDEAKDVVVNTLQLQYNADEKGSVDGTRQTEYASDRKQSTKRKHKSSSSAPAKKQRQQDESDSDSDEEDEGAVEHSVEQECCDY